MNKTVIGKTGSILRLINHLSALVPIDWYKYCYLKAVYIYLNFYTFKLEHIVLNEILIIIFMIII